MRNKDVAVNHRGTTGTRGVIFDLDGTLVDSGLDFDAMRREIGLPERMPILEAMAQMSSREATRCAEIVERHEWAGVQRAIPFPGAREFLEELAALGWRQAVLTRNSRQAARETLARFGWQFAPVLGREDAPPKPHPEGIRRILENWGFETEQVIFVGDFHFDMLAARRAGVKRVLYAGKHAVDDRLRGESCDFVIHCYRELDRFWEWASGLA